MLLRPKGLVYRVLKRLFKRFYYVRQYGLLFYLRYRFADEFQKHSKPVCRVQLRGFAHPFYFRHNTSDLRVMNMVLEQGEYAPIHALEAPSVIVDCGANIGSTSFSLLHRYSHARLIAIEPDEGNARLCRMNLAPFGDRATVIVAGIWLRSAELAVSRTGFRDDQEWSFTVRECREGEMSDVHGIDLDTLMRDYNIASIDLLKVDIEGSEAEVFANPSAVWLTRTKNIAIELHNEECERVFNAAMVAYEHTRETKMETTFCFDLQHKAKQN